MRHSLAHCFWRWRWWRVCGQEETQGDVRQWKEAWYWWAAILVFLTKRCSQTFGQRCTKEGPWYLSVRSVFSIARGVRQNNPRWRAQALLQHSFSWPFKEPVDPIALGIPDYFDYIKRPMDLGTIKQKMYSVSGRFIAKLICQGGYVSGDDFAKDVRLVWNNALYYNQPSTEVYKMAHVSSFLVTPLTPRPCASCSKFHSIVSSLVMVPLTN